MLDRIDLYENNIFERINRYNKKIQKFIATIDVAFLAFIKVFEFIILFLPEIFKYTQKFLRYTTFPIHWVWIKHYLKKNQKEQLTDKPIFEKGGHYIYGKPGAGKSTVIYHAMMDYAYYSGRASYTTVRMELPRKNIFGHEYFIHQLFSPGEFFQKGEQIVQLNTNLFNVIVYEELLGTYHQRNNSSNEHNHEVLPLVASMGAQRHQGKGIDLFYFISQLPGNDISIMQMLKGYHIPKIKKGFDYKHWLSTGQFKFGIKGWWIESYKVVPNGRSDYKLVDKVKWFYEFKFEEEFKYFNRLNLQDKFKEKPLHKGVEMVI